jgi:hypothetical protein
MEAGWEPPGAALAWSGSVAGIGADRASRTAARSRWMASASTPMMIAAAAPNQASPLTQRIPRGRE